MTVWHWVRHGPTHAKNFVGWRDLPADLSDTAQIERLKAHLPQHALLLASDLTRARQTADAIQGEYHTRLADSAHLREINFGIWEGMHFEDISRRDPVLSRQFWENPGDIAAPQGESWNDAAARIAGMVDHLNYKYPSSDIIVAAHFGAILTQVQRAAGMTAYDTLAHRIDNFSVTRIVWEDNAGRVEAINHLP